MKAACLQAPEVGSLVWDLLEQERIMELSHMAAALVRFYLAKEAVIEYLDRLVQRDLDRTGESGVYLAKEPSIEYLDRLVLRHLDETGIRERIQL